jgi:8-oxo-dGTP pyrophosphatase MutT (NUDIX family)
MLALDLDRVREALAPPALEIAGSEETRRAAVSAILHPARGDVEVLFIRRAERPDDPWSGHMAFPGGRQDRRDADLRATAVRETREEVGIDLEAGAELVGRLDDVVPGSSRGLVTGLVVSPFVWTVREVPHVLPNGVEVDEIHWAPLGPMLRGERDGTYPYVWRGQPMQFPAYRVGSGDTERLVWGMTHRMLQTFFARLRSAMLTG